MPLARLFFGSSISSGIRGAACIMLQSAARWPALGAGRVGGGGGVDGGAASAANAARSASTMSALRRATAPPQRGGRAPVAAAAAAIGTRRLSSSRAAAAAAAASAGGGSNSNGRFLFSSESVTEGHPDKLCDGVSDAVLDACLEQDPDAKVCALFVCFGRLVCAGGLLLAGVLAGQRPSPPSSPQRCQNPNKRPL